MNDVRQAAEALRAARGRRCNVCTGRSPKWDGHDRNPMCEQAAWDDLDASLDASGAPCADCGKAEALHDVRDEAYRGFTCPVDAERED